MPKKPLFLVLPYLGPLSLQTRTKLRKFAEGIFNCFKLQIAFKGQNKLANSFRFKDRIPKELTSVVVYKFQCGLCNEFYNGEYVRQFNVRMGSISEFHHWLRRKLIDHFLFCNHSQYFENFSEITKENRKFVLELKESLLIMKDKPSLNRNIRIALLYLFDRIQLR